MVPQWPPQQTWAVFVMLGVCRVRKAQTPVNSLLDSTMSARDTNLQLLYMYLLSLSVLQDA